MLAEVAMRVDRPADLVGITAPTPSALHAYALADELRNIDTALGYARATKAGTVWVNTYNVYDTAAPFGGYKQSGIGREKGREALHHYSQLKTVIVTLT